MLELQVYMWGRMTAPVEMKGGVAEYNQSRRGVIRKEPRSIKEEDSTHSQSWRGQAGGPVPGRRPLYAASTTASPQLEGGKAVSFPSPSALPRACTDL